MKWSALTALEVPYAVVTRRSTTPEAWAGATTVSLVDETTWTLVPLVLPKRTALTCRKCVPLTVTLVLPVTGPLTGAADDTVGGAT